MESTRGKLIVFEGNDGVGKTSIIFSVIKMFEKKGINILYCHFPGKYTKRLGELVDAIHHKAKFLNEYNLDFCPLVLQTLHVAAHIDLEKTYILPKLEKGSVIFLDRSWLSTLAYGSAYGVPENELETLVQLERYFLPATLFDALIYVVRDNDDKGAYKEKILGFYEMYIQKYINQNNVHLICNNDDLDSAVNRVYLQIDELIKNED